MATDETKKSDPPESGPDSGEEEEVHTAVETVDAKKKAASEPPAKAAADEDDDEDGTRDVADDDESEDDEVEDDDEDEVADEAPEPAPKVAKAAKPADDAHAAGHGHGGLAHVTPVPLLFAVLGGLLFLTFATVEVTSFDMGGQWNLVAAMVIATMKASLVVTFFMHLAWDKKFNLVLFLTSVLFLILFLGMTLTDRKEYQHFIDQKAETAAQTTAQ